MNVEMTPGNCWYQNSTDNGVGLGDPCDSGQIMFSDISFSIEIVTCCYRSRIEGCMFFFLGSPVWLNYIGVYMLVDALWQYIKSNNVFIIVF